MLPLVAGGVLLSLLSMGNRYKTANQQLRDADRYSKWQRPDAEIPSAINDYVARTRSRAGNYGIPGQAQAEAKLGRSQAATNDAIINSQQGPSAQLTGLVEAGRNTQEGMNNLAVAGAEHKDAAEREYDQALNELGGWQQRKWEWDKKMPYLSAMATASSFRNAGMINKQRVIDDITGLGTNMLSAGMMGGRGTNDGSVPVTMGDLTGASNVSRVPSLPITPIPATGMDYSMENETPSFDFDSNMFRPGYGAPYEQAYNAIKQAYPHFSDEQIAQLFSNMTR